MPKALTKKTILITGASSGFGKLTVPLLLEKGHTIIAGIRGGEERLKAVFATEMNAYPGQLHGLDLHLEKSSQFSELARELERRFPSGLDVLVNNAGYGLLGVIEDQTEEQIRYQMEINFFGTALLTRALLPMLRRARGRILNISSLAGLMSFPFYGLYSASKFALEGFSEALFHDLRPFGVQVGLIEPGGFRTAFVQARQFGEILSEHSPYAARTRNFQTAFEMTSARLDDPMKVARLISKLCDSGRVPLRTAIGRDARLLTLLKRLLPERPRLRLIGWAFNHAMGHASKS